MGNFIENLTYQQSSEYQLQKRKESVEYSIQNIIGFVKTQITYHFSDHKLEGYLFYYDGDMWLKPQPYDHNENLYQIDPDIVYFFKEKLSSNLISLGVRLNTLNCPTFDEYTYKTGLIRDRVYYKTGKQFCGLYLSISW